MTPLMAALALFVWCTLGDVLDLLGYKAQPNLDVYDRWVDVQLTRTYAPGYKGIG